MAINFCRNSVSGSYGINITWNNHLSKQVVAITYLAYFLAGTKIICGYNFVAPLTSMFCGKKWTLKRVP